MLKRFAGRQLSVIGSFQQQAHRPDLHDYCFVFTAILLPLRPMTASNITKLRNGLNGVVLGKKNRAKLRFSLESTVFALRTMMNFHVTNV